MQLYIRRSTDSCGLLRRIAPLAITLRLQTLKLRTRYRQATQERSSVALNLKQSLMQFPQLLQPKLTQQGQRLPEP